MNIEVGDWEELQAQVETLRATYASRNTPLHFRGQANSNWTLDTTLERAGKTGMRLSEYYRIAASIRPEIESFTGTTWEIPAFPEVERLFSEYDTGSLELSFGRFPAYDYMIYLRHHGFPSPLLDWSLSLQVATFFALEKAVGCEKASIYVFVDRKGVGKLSGSDTARIQRFGHNVRTHRRHFLQQSEYTVCAHFKDEWYFEPHETVFSKGSAKQDLSWRIDIPTSERQRILTLLDSYNLNAFSLYGSEEGLMHTMAVRKFSG